MGHLKNLYELVTIFFCFLFCFWPREMWDLSSPTRDWNCTPFIGRQSSNHWITREVYGNREWLNKPEGLLAYLLLCVVEVQMFCLGFDFCGGQWYLFWSRLFAILVESKISNFQDKVQDKLETFSIISLITYLREM